MKRNMETKITTSQKKKERKKADTKTEQVRLTAPVKTVKEN